MTKELWRPIKNYEEQYECSNYGRVRSIERTIIRSDGRKHHRNSQILKPQANMKNGLFQVMLVVERKYKLFYLHRIIAETWCENPKPDEYNVVRHINGFLEDNRADNLVWCTKSMNLNKRLNLI